MKVASQLIGGRLALDFVNTWKTHAELTWDVLISFLGGAGIVSAERRAQLVALPQTDSQAAAGLLNKSQRLCNGMRLAFSAMVRKQSVPKQCADPINEILEITEGHDELVYEAGVWRMDFIAREDGLDWLLAAIARSAAEIIAEGANARLQLCANPRCGLLFYDHSRTHRRRWCSMAVCGNRSKVAAFARRHSASHRAL